MRTSNVRFGEAYKLSMPVWKAEQVGHDGIGITQVDMAPLKYNSERWNMLQGVLKKRGAGLINAFDPVTHKQTTFILTNGVKKDTFERVQYLRKQLAEVSGLSKKDERIHNALGFMISMNPPGIINGDEPEIVLSENITKQAEELERWGIREVLSD